MNTSKENRSSLITANEISLDNPKEKLKVKTCTSFNTPKITKVNNIFEEKLKSNNIFSSQKMTSINTTYLSLRYSFIKKIRQKESIPLIFTIK